VTAVTVGCTRGLKICL